MGWQPIDSAPKDGTEILVYCPAGQQAKSGWAFGPAIQSVKWDGSLTHQNSMWWTLTGYHEADAWPEPTHWMPLPPPPEPAPG
jgi:hypothetical protein